MTGTVAPDEVPGGDLLFVPSDFALPARAEPPFDGGAPAPADGPPRQRALDLVWLLVVVAITAFWGGVGYLVVLALG